MVLPSRLGDRFELLAPLGEGGFATVYRARESASGRLVALKLLKEVHRHDPEVIERFSREVFAVASLNSPFVVKLHDFGLSGEELFIAMELVEGPTLRQLMHERAWRATDIHLVVGQIAQALTAAHRQAIVHRDLKPENVVFMSQGAGTYRVKVLDFGLAKLAELERQLGLAPLTRVGMCFGTPQYMAPEQIRGHASDGSVDCYALAVMAYELVAGLLPWDGDSSREVLMSVVQHPPPRIVSPRATGIERLAAINDFFDRALAKRPADRPRDAAALFEELEQALFSRPPRRPVSQSTDPVFASILGAAIALPPLAERCGPHAGPCHQQPLRAEWIQSVGFDGAETLALTPPFADSPTTLDERGPPDVAVPERQERPRSALWLFAGLVTLLMLAAALGYWAGRRG